MPDFADLPCERRITVRHYLGRQVSLLDADRVELWSFLRGKWFLVAAAYTDTAHCALIDCRKAYALPTCFSYYGRFREGQRLYKAYAARKGTK